MSAGSLNELRVHAGAPTDRQGRSASQRPGQQLERSLELVGHQVAVQAVLPVGTIGLEFRRADVVEVLGLLVLGMRAVVAMLLSQLRTFMAQRVPDARTGVRCASSGWEEEGAGLVGARVHRYCR